MSGTVARIFQEEPLFADPVFHIVVDKEPVCPEHYLVLPRDQYRSLAALPIEHKSYLEELLRAAFGGKGFFLLERGNVSFCTSINGPAYAHGHLVNGHYFSSNLLRQFSDLENGVPARSLSHGLSLPGVAEEYLLAGAIGDAWSVVFPFCSPVKRYIRRTLEGRRL